MTDHDHDVENTDEEIALETEDQANAVPEKLISFNVDATSAVGEPVFPEEGLSAIEAAEESAEESEEESAEESEDVAEEESDENFPLQEELTLSGKIESILFASPKPMRAVEVHELLLDNGYTLKEVQDACDQLIEFYRDRAGGFHLKYIKRMGYQFQTTPAAKPLMEKQFSSRPRPLSRAALETLAVIAYRQKGSKGVTRAEVEFIRGVDAGSIFKTLSERSLLTCTGRKEIPGRPMMFGVTDEFLKIFQLGSINDLPPLESFQTPQDVLDAATQKIANFEAEQEGVDTEEFIADEVYSAETQSPEEFNPLAANAASYAPTLERVSEASDAVAAAETDTVVVQALEASQGDLIDVLNEGQVAWVATDVHTEERPIQGATTGDPILFVAAINEDEWDQDVQVEMTSTESADAVSIELSSDASSEAQPDERDETAEVAIPTGDSEPPRSGEVDQ